MKKQTKGIFAFLFLGGIMVTSGVVIAFPGVDPGSDSPELTVTGTPADNFPDEQRSQFCGSSNAQSTNFFKNFQFPPCVQTHLQL